MNMHNTESKAWEQICSLTDQPENELKKLGVAIPLFNPSFSPMERCLAACGCYLIIKFENKEILASITNNSVPAGKLPRPRLFSIEGSVDSPRFVEQTKDAIDAKQAFHDLIDWFVKACC